MSRKLKIKVQVFCGEEIAMGPGKAALLSAIAAEGSISAAARKLGMSYRRAWLLVDTMNRCWRAPVVATMPGGSARGGAKVTELGQAVLDHYRALVESAEQSAAAPDWTALHASLLLEPREAQSLSSPPKPSASPRA